MIGIFALGSNGSGQLGVGHQDDTSTSTKSAFSSPTASLPSPRAPVARVAAGGNHTLLLTRDGQVFTAGQNESGARGQPLRREDLQGNDFSRLVINELGPDNDDLGEVSLIAATWEASLVVQKDGRGKNTRLHSLGTGSRGELGLGLSGTVSRPSACMLKNFPPGSTEIVDIHACMDHIVAVLSNGDAYAWGNCRKGQAGEPKEVVLSPRKIEGLDFHVVRAVCTKETSVLFGAPGSGRMAVLGSDKWSLRSSAPERVPAWKDVGASWGGIYILTEENGIVAWGRNDHGQLPPASLPPVDMMAVGSEHVVARTVDGNVVAWGWGEHGNCGKEEESVDIKGKGYNIIASMSSQEFPAGSVLESIGAGCATSFICVTSKD